jgi:hypothetical protein
VDQLQIGEDVRQAFAVMPVPLHFHQLAGVFRIR